MSTLFTSVAHVVQRAAGRWTLGVAIAGGGLVSTAQAHHHDDFDLRIDIAHRGAEIERRHYCEPVYEQRPAQVWVAPVYQTVPGERVWIEPVYRTVCDRVWREAVMRDEVTQVWIEEHFDRRVVRHGRHEVVERCFVPGHYESRCAAVVVAPGHYEEVQRQELVSEGHWQVSDQQVLVTPGHFETRLESVCVTPGHWEDHPLVRLR